MLKLIKGEMLKMNNNNYKTPIIIIFILILIITGEVGYLYFDSKSKSPAVPNNNLTNPKNNNQTSENQPDKPEIKDNQEPNNNTTSSKLISINEKINATTNLFQYSNYEWDYDASFYKDGAMIWMGTIKNISNEPLNYNIHIKFYDSNKKLIGEYQHETTKKSDNEKFALDPNESRNLSFSFYSKYLNNNHSVSEIKYISIEDIIFNEEENF